LLQSFKLSGLLDQSLWTNLDTFAGRTQDLKLIHNGVDLVAETIPVQLLPEQYEVDRYRKNLKSDLVPGFVKDQLFDFNNKLEWGEIYIEPKPYIDTYFSLVTETVFSYPYSFRTEKIWKPIAIGHPWIAVANVGYYRDMRSLGFRTFDHIIDETFDTIDNDMDRITRIRDIVVDLCKSTANLKDFLAAARPVCEYNQKHLWNMREKVRQEFPERFIQFIRDNKLTR